MSFFDAQNPGIGGLDELTEAETILIQNLASLGDPNADRILFWDDSAGEYAYLTVGSGLSITGTTLTASAGAIDGSGTTNEITYWVDSNTLGSLAVATYPSLTELAYVKGVTSAIQTQLNAKAAALTADENYVTDAQLVVISNTSGTNTGDQTTVSGNAGTATVLASTRTIWGQNFNGSANVTGDLTLGAQNLTMTGSLAATGARVTKGWFTDIESTNVPTVGGTSLYATTATLTNKAVTQRVVTATDDATAVIDVAVTDVYELSAIANNTTFSFTGSPTDGQKFIVRYKDAGVSKTLTWTGFVAIGITLPTATTASKWGYVGVVYNSAASAYHAVATTTEA